MRQTGSCPIHWSPSLATDLYELTMAAGYFANDRRESATFELFVRDLPAHRFYLVAAGLRQAVDYLLALRFSTEDIAHLKTLPPFKHIPRAFFDFLASFRFRGDLWAVPEGTVVFAGEPLIRVTAPIVEAQIVETFLLATINHQTLVATKAARIVEAAAGRGVVEFGSRRAHGPEAGILAARAAVIGGCIGTSNVEAGRLFGINVYGTAAHSWIMTFESEMEAFRAYHRVFPKSTTLLLDTYDPIEAARLAVRIGPTLKGVRLDSGDLAEQAGRVRGILDEAGMTETKIMLSGDLNEFRIAALVENGVPVDLFGVGNELVNSPDAPSLSGVYKLCALESPSGTRPVFKLSEGKQTRPYAKQVWRRRNGHGEFVEDRVTRDGEPAGSPEWEPLLGCVLRSGRIDGPMPDLSAAGRRRSSQLRSLPARYKQREDPGAYPVRFSAQLSTNR
jgi:nicotinate phosphoribosyltransferase